MRCRKQTRKIRVHWLAIVIPVALSVGACTTARVNQFNSFAKAGGAYTEAVGPFLEEAGAAAISTDTMVLLKARDVTPAAQRGQLIIGHNNLLRERLALLGDIKRHATLLRTYFEALGALAESDAPSGIGNAAEGVVKSMGRVNKEIASAKVGELDVSSFAGQVAKISVANFQRAALERELKERGPTIERELDLQHAAITAVAEQLRTDLQAQLLQQESREVVLPFAGSGSLPSGWAGKRETVLRANLTLASASAAADAAKQLQIAFVALVEGRIESTDLSLLINEMSEIVALIGAIKGKQE